MVIENNLLEPEIGFRKGDINNIPNLHNEALLKFVGQAQISDSLKPENNNLLVDYIQVRKDGDIFEVRALTFPAIINSQIKTFVKVTMKYNSKTEEITETSCEKCTEPSLCVHIVTFLFWLNRKSMDGPTASVVEFWGCESETIKDQKPTDAIRIRDLIQCDELRLECDIESASQTELDERVFLDAVMDEMEAVGLRETVFSRYGRPITDEFEPIFIHHVMLDMPNNFVRDMRSFLLHMEDQSKQGLLDRLAEVSCQNYKSSLWLEAQFMRLRCSLVHRIASRRESFEDEEILNSLFLKNRDRSVESRQQLKQHKRFILKQTEKLENKTYHECGILISESYPYICATPDGITDDHIVEIKAPRTEAEFEQYLEGRETIAPKYMAQIQIQMYVANVTKALYCVLSPTFDTNGALHYVWVQADMEFVASLLGAAEDFWKDVVFPRLANIYFTSR